MNAPHEFKTGNGSMHVLYTRGDASAEKIVLLGGYSRKLVLYSNSDYTLTKCDLHKDYSGCRLMMHICILYSPGPVLAVLAHRMGIWSHPLKNGLIQHTSNMNYVFFEKFPVIPEVSMMFQ